MPTYLVYLIPLLPKRGQAVLNISSGIGFLSLVGGIKLPMVISPAYIASKTALNMITKLTADQFAEGNFICTTISLGWVATDTDGSGGLAPLQPA